MRERGTADRFNASFELNNLMCDEHEKRKFLAQRVYGLLHSRSNHSWPSNQTPHIYFRHNFMPVYRRRRRKQTAEKKHFCTYGQSIVCAPPHRIQCDLEFETFLRLFYPPKNRSYGTETEPFIRVSFRSRTRFNGIEWWSFAWIKVKMRIGFMLKHPNEPFHSLSLSIPITSSSNETHTSWIHNRICLSLLPIHSRRQKIYFPECVHHIRLCGAGDGYKFNLIPYDTRNRNQNRYDFIIICSLHAWLAALSDPKWTPSPMHYLHC